VRLGAGGTIAGLAPAAVVVVDTLTGDVFAASGALTVDGGAELPDGAPACCVVLVRPGADVDDGARLALGLVGVELGCGTAIGVGAVTDADGLPVVVADFELVGDGADELVVGVA